MKCLMVAVGSFAVSMSFLVTAPAAAEGDGTGGGWTPGAVLQQDAAEVALLEAKLAAAADYGLLKEQAMSAAPTTPLACANDPGTPCPENTEATLQVTHVPQNTNYYCGPAVGTMLLRRLAEGTSSATGDSLGQGNVANAAHMRTDINGKTAWASGLFRVGINKWRGNDSYVNLKSPTNKRFRDVIATNIDSGYPFASSTVEFANGAHYNGRPVDQLIGHWILGRGYAAKLDDVKFMDPAANSSALSSAWSNVNPAFTATTNYFNQQYQQSHGITW